MLQRIYVLTNPLGNYYKLGISKDPKDRCRHLSKQCGVPLEIVYTTVPMYNARIIEKKLLRLLGEYKTFGEWVKCSKHKIIATIQDQEKDFLFEPGKQIEIPVKITRTVEEVKHIDTSTLNYYGLPGLYECPKTKYFYICFNLKSHIKILKVANSSDAYKIYEKNKHQCVNI